MTADQLAGLAILIGFYGIYLGKMASQRARGIRTNQIGKGNKENGLRRVELAMSVATVAIVAAEALCLLLRPAALPAPARMAGMALGFCGVLVFGLSVWTMRDSWRAGIPEQDRTELVTVGIYSLSRNPAFLGFDLVYLGLLLMFFHWAHLLLALFAIVMLHLQILQEERFLPTVFGQAYWDYRARVRRYLGRKKPR